MRIGAPCTLPLSHALPSQRKSFLIDKPTCPNPLNHRDVFSGPVLRHGSLNPPFQVPLHLPSQSSPPTHSLPCIESPMSRTGQSNQKREQLEQRTDQLVNNDDFYQKSKARIWLFSRNEIAPPLGNQLTLSSEPNPPQISPHTPKIKPKTPISLPAVNFTDSLGT